MKCTLMEHQKDAVSFALKNNGVSALYHEVGCGKTISALSIFESLRAFRDPSIKLLVICPISLIHGAWSKEIDKFTAYNWWDLHGKRGKVQAYNRNFTPDIYLINFESLIVKKRFEDLKVLLSSGGDWMVAIDESSKMKNHSAGTTERLLGWWEKKKYTAGIRQFCKYRVLMSGTPAPNIEWEYWAQMAFLDASILGDNFFKFRNIFFEMRRGREVLPQGVILNKATLSELYNNGYKYIFNEARRQTFFESMKPWCHLVKAKDCLDLPEAVDEYRVIEMKDDQLRVYKEMKNQYIAEIREMMKKPEEIVIPEELRSEPNSHIIVANIVLTKMMKLRQITSGFAIDEAHVAHAVGKGNPKLDALSDIIEECGKEQIIIWCQFRWEIAEIKKLLEGFGISELHGGVKQEDRIHHVNDFLSGKNRFLLAHPDSAAHGLTFVNCHFAVFFSYSYSYEEYSQAKGRIMRHGQRNRCVYFHLVAENSVDEDILAVCQRKQDKQDVAERFLKNA